MFACVKNVFLLIFGLLVLPLTGICQCTYTAADNVITGPSVTDFCGDVDIPVLLKGSAPTGPVTYQWEQSNDNIHFFPRFYTSFAEFRP